MANRYARDRTGPMDYQYDARPIAAFDASSPTYNEAADGAQNQVPPTPPQTSSPFGTNTPNQFAFQTPAIWAPPANFSPEKAFPKFSDETDSADVSMSTAGPSTPERSSLRRRTSKERLDGGSDLALSSISPLRRSTFKSRDRDRSRERERERGRRRGLIKRRVDSGDEDDSDEENEQDNRQLGVSNHYNLHLPTPSLAHGDVPYVLSGYLQFFFNLSLVITFLYLTGQFIRTIQRDVDQKVAEYSTEILHEISHCTSEYLSNKCDPLTRIPHMGPQCTEWEVCMNRDPTVVGRARVSAETFAEVVNAFVDRISWKTMGFTVVTLSFIVIITNVLLTIYRSNHAPQPPATPQPPQTPQLVNPLAMYPQVQWGGVGSTGGGQWSRAGTPFSITESPRKSRAKILASKMC